MIFYQFFRHNTIKNILFAGVGVTAFLSLNEAAANNYASSHDAKKASQKQVTEV
jgi:hypothetical protein